MSNKRVSQGQWPNWGLQDWSEYPSEDSSGGEIWGYTGKLSYAPGEELELHINCSGKDYSIEIVRDGAEWETVYHQEQLPAAYYPTPQNSYEVGCQWPVAHRIKIPEQWKSGAYLIILRTAHNGIVTEQEAFFTLRAASPGDKDREPSGCCPRRGNSPVGLPLCEWSQADPLPRDSCERCRDIPHNRAPPLPPMQVPAQPY